MRPGATVLLGGLVIAGVLRYKSFSSPPPPLDDVAVQLEYDGGALVNETIVAQEVHDADLALPAGNATVLLQQEEAAGPREAGDEDRGALTAPIPVVVLSVGRSGSTLLGSLFNADKSFLYVYEPCRRHHGWGHYVNEQCAQLALALTTCSLSRGEAVNLFEDVTARMASVGLTAMAEGPMAPQIAAALADFRSRKRGAPSYFALAKQFNDECRKARAVVAKVIRIMDVPRWLPEAVKVVHLMRDPRAVVLSQSHTKNFDGRGLASTAREVCEISLRTARQLADSSLKNVCRVRYEDMCRAPEATVAAIYDCLGLGPPAPDILEWIAQNMHDDGQDADRSRYTEHRNATDIVLHWADRWGVKKEEADLIDEHCAEAAKILGYDTHW